MAFGTGVAARRDDTHLVGVEAGQKPNAGVVLLLLGLQGKHAGSHACKAPPTQPFT